jgi:hypothetical protein
VPLEFLPPTCFTVNPATRSVFIQGVEYNLVKCYHRVVPNATTVTVRDALSHSGSQNECRLDDKFCLYFENTDHALIRLQNETQRTEANFQFLNNDQQVQFFDPFFDLNPWTECGTEFVKIPIAVILLVLAGLNVEAAKAQLSADHRNTIDALEQVFQLSDVDKLGETNAALEHLFVATNFDAVGLIERKKIVDILDAFASDVWGEDPYYVDELRPILLLEDPVNTIVTDTLAVDE